MIHVNMSIKVFLVKKFDEIYILLYSLESKVNFVFGENQFLLGKLVFSKKNLKL